MKKIFSLFVLSTILLLGITSAFTQVSISSDGSDPAASAMLEVKATNKGFLPPRVSLASITDVTTIPSPVAGLLVYNTNASIVNGYNTGYYFYTGTKWSKIASNTTHYIGESYGGGTIFWLDESGEHGLVAALVDLGSTAGTKWYNNTFKITGANHDGVYAGKTNTDKIVASQGTGTYAAALCRDYYVTIGNIFYTDWYLPSKYELNQMYLNRNLLAPFNYSYGVYWSSTEGTQLPASQAFDQVFMTGIGSGIQDESPKDWLDLVRCVRKF
ncbi:MAG: hypothetical protein ACOYNC_14660 [Bacteroidales bacterium]